MRKEEMVKSLKRYLKRKITINNATIIAFLITGGFFFVNTELNAAVAIGSTVTTGTANTVNATGATATGNNVASVQML